MAVIDSAVKNSGTYFLKPSRSGEISGHELCEQFEDLKRKWLAIKEGPRGRLDSPTASLTSSEISSGTSHFGVKRLSLNSVSSLGSGSGSGSGSEKGSVRADERVDLLVLARREVLIEQKRGAVSRLHQHAQALWFEASDALAIVEARASVAPKVSVEQQLLTKEFSYIADDDWLLEEHAEAAYAEEVYAEEVREKEACASDEAFLIAGHAALFGAVEPALAQIEQLVADRDVLLLEVEKLNKEIDGLVQQNAQARADLAQRLKAQTAPRPKLRQGATAPLRLKGVVNRSDMPQTVAVSIKTVPARTSARKSTAIFSASSSVNLPASAVKTDMQPINKSEERRRQQAIIRQKKQAVIERNRQIARGELKVGRP